MARLRKVLNVLILTAAVIALAQFGVYYWRSLIHTRATQPLSERFRHAVGYESSAPGAQDFAPLLSFYRSTPELKNRANKLCGIRAYYTVVGVLQKLPALHRWAQSEMAVCAKYVAVLVDQRIEGNLSYAAEMRCR
jgi:hypothetical protein